MLLYDKQSENDSDLKDLFLFSAKLGTIDLTLFGRQTHSVSLNLD